MEIKKCYKCGEIKEISQFSLNKSRKDGHNSACRRCHSKLRRAHYVKNHNNIIKQVREYKKSISKFIRDYKIGKACCDCHIIYPYYVLDFDHKHDKKFTISRAYRVAGRKQLLIEIAKCDLVCANCHRIRTHSGKVRA